MTPVRKINDRTWRWYADDGCWWDETSTHKIVPLRRDHPLGPCILFSCRHRPGMQQIATLKSFRSAALHCEMTW